MTDEFKPTVAEPEAKAEEAKPEPKVLSQVLISHLDDGRIAVQSNLAEREDMLMLIREGRRVIAKAIAGEAK